MSYKRITDIEKERVYADGRQAFGEYTPRSDNPHAASNLTLAVSWWHGWDTAEEEGKEERSPFVNRSV
ncbi:MAG TPA: hypothetical protein VMN99_06460 [Anaerolineales bacterium]|nr:hypothetical protein [Anaerolineales bacterium]